MLEGKCGLLVLKNSCRKLIQQEIYDSVALLVSSDIKEPRGEFSGFGSELELKRFLTELLTHLQWRLEIMG